MCERLRLHLGAPLALALCLSVAPARAQSDRAPSAEDSALAETLFRDGRKLLEGGEVDAACSKLESSQKLDAKVSTLLNLAACHELQGRTASAWAEFLEAARLTRVTPVRDPKALEQTARARAEALAPRIHRLALEKPEQLPQDLELLVDGRPIPRGAWSSPIPVDPGEHEISARATNHSPWSRKMTVSGDARLHPFVVPALVPLPPSEAGKPEAPLRQRPVSARLVSAPFLLSATIGAFGLGVGSFLGVRAISLKDERDAECDAAGCSKAGLEKQSQAEDAALGSTIGFGVGAAGAAFAIYWLVRSDPVRGASLTPFVACIGASCGATLRGAF